LLFALRGSAEPARVAAYPHYWMRAAQFGRFRRLARAAGCREVVLIGSVVRPTLAGLWPDYGLIPLLPRLIRIFSGGDDHLLSGVAGIFERNGFKMVGAHEIAPDIGMPEGPLGRVVPMERDHADIARALALLRATGPFDVGQAVVVADGRVLAIEAAEGTDEMLAKLAELRAGGRIRVPMGAGVLVKAPKPGQDHRFDLPSIGPQTIERAAGAGLAGIAVIAGGTIIAEPQAVAAAADRRNIFVVGIGAGDIRE
jgi:DUF1009 family protein